MKITITKTIVLKLTGKEYQLLQDAAELVDNIISGIDNEDDEIFEGRYYDLRGASNTIYEFLDDPNVEVEWE